MKEYKAFLDFEFNSCSKKTEIISIGCCILDDNFKIVDKFYSLIKPYNIILNNFVKKLTNITEEQLENAPLFIDVSNSFYEFISKYNNILYYCWGCYDNIAVKNSCILNDYYLMKNTIGKIVNIQKNICSSIRQNNNVIKRAFKLETIGKFYDIKFDNLHNSLYDAILLAKIYKEFNNRGSYEFITNTFENAVSEKKLNISKNIISEEIKKLPQNFNENYFETNRERFEFLYNFSKDKKRVSELTMSIYDNCKKYYKESLIFSSNNLKMSNIKKENLSGYLVCYDFNSDDNCFYLTIKYNKNFITTKINITSKSFKKIKKILKRMQQKS